VPETTITAGGGGDGEMLGGMQTAIMVRLLVWHTSVPMQHVEPHGFVPAPQCMPLTVSTLHTTAVRGG
jgi:hypothetical protein